MQTPAQRSPDDIVALSGRPIVVVGGVGGSGTRAVAAALIALGVDMGSDLNESLDDLSFNILFKRRSFWPLGAHHAELEQALQYYLSARGILRQEQGLGKAQHVELSNPADWPASLATYFARIAGDHDWQSREWLLERLRHLLVPQRIDRRWGWKEPNSHVVLPFLLASMPQLKYVHVIRHGLDMAFSGNQNQLGLWGQAFLGRPVNRESAQDSFDYWCAVHQRLLEVAGEFPGRVYLLNFEAMCAQPDSYLADLVEFFQLDAASATAVNDIAQEITPPPTCNRYHSARPFAVTQKQRALLDTLGYACHW